MRNLDRIGINKAIMEELNSDDLYLIATRCLDRLKELDKFSIIKLLIDHCSGILHNKIKETYL